MVSLKTAGLAYAAAMQPQIEGEGRGSWLAARGLWLVASWLRGPWLVASWLVARVSRFAARSSWLAARGSWLAARSSRLLLAVHGSACDSWLVACGSWLGSWLVARTSHQEELGGARRGQEGQASSGWSWSLLAPPGYPGSSWLSWILLALSFKDNNWKLSELLALKELSQLLL